MTQNIDYRRVRILFLCWGDSIHARRRIQLFIDDELFEVAVVSTFDYGLSGARFFPLLAAQGKQTAASCRKRPILSRLSTEACEVLRHVRGLVFLSQELLTLAGDWRILKNAVASFRPDLVFLQTLLYPCYLAYLLPRSMPMAVTFWNGDVTHFAKWTGLEMFFKRWLVKYGLKRIDLITANSQTAIDACISLGADRKKLNLIRYPAADIDAFAKRDKAVARQKLDISNRHVVLCPRGLGMFFNSDIIVEAMARVLKRQPDTLFLFISGVGGLSEWERHKRQATELNVDGNMRWDGQIPWEEMPWYYSAADVMVSIMDADSCPNCMLEAMAASLPVIMSDTKQNREWITDGYNGFLVPSRNPDLLADRILALLEEKSSRAAQFAQNSLSRVCRDGNSRKNVPKIKELILHYTAAASYNR